MGLRGFTFVVVDFMLNPLRGSTLHTPRRFRYAQYWKCIVEFNKQNSNWKSLKSRGPFDLQNVTILIVDFLYGGNAGINITHLQAPWKHTNLQHTLGTIFENPTREHYQHPAQPSLAQPAGPSQPSPASPAQPSTAQPAQPAQQSGPADPCCSVDKYLLYIKLVWFWNMFP